MNETQQDNDSEFISIEAILARLLRIGSVIATILLGAGMLSMGLGNLNEAPRLFTSGLLVMLATPVMRVLVAGLVFAKKKDWLFFIICFVVLCTLTAGILLGNGE